MSEGTSYIRVAIPVPLPRTFTYRLPKEFPEPALGGRILVPFGKRVLLAYAVGPGEAPEGVDVKDILEVFDETPFLPAPLVELTRRMAEYYVASWGDMLRLAYPRGLDPALVRSIKMVHSAQEILDLLPEPSGPLTRLLEALGRARKPTVENLKTRLKDLRVYQLLLQLRKAGYLSWQVEARDIKRRERPKEAMEQKPDTPPELTPEQKAALNLLNPMVEENKHHTALIHGTTGSGKTEVYLRLIQKVLAQGGQAMYLVPEIALTSQLSQRLRARLGDQVAIFHSGLGEAERVALWQDLAAGRYALAAGPRSVLFAPLSNLKLIVVDEEHDGSYKQEEHPRYHARDMAILRGHIEDFPVILGSATPSVETSRAARQGKFLLTEMPHRVGGASLPTVELIDMRMVYQETGAQPLIAPALLEGLTQCLADGHQAILLRNRRGFFSSLLCRACGEVVQCKHCAISLTYHKRRDRLRCHFCGFSRALPLSCPSCKDKALQLLGDGTEQVEEVLKKLLPGATIGRMDRDTIRHPKEMAQLLEDFDNHTVDILVGTQMVAKGHHFPNVSLVGVLSADGPLSLPDFRAGERTFQLLTQVVGRAGRGDIPGRAFLQVFHPEHPVVEAAMAQDYEAFYTREWAFREVLGYPPKAYLAFLIFQDVNPEKAWLLARKGATRLVKVAPKGLRVLGPNAAPIERLKNRYRVQVLLKAPSRKVIQTAVHRLLEEDLFLKAIPAKMEVDIDPVSVM